MLEHMVDCVDVCASYEKEFKRLNRALYVVIKTNLDAYKNLKPIDMNSIKQATAVLAKQSQRKIHPLNLPWARRWNELCGRMCHDFEMIQNIVLADPEASWLCHPQHKVIEDQFARLAQALSGSRIDSRHEMTRSIRPGELDVDFLKYLPNSGPQGYFGGRVHTIVDLPPGRIIFADKSTYCNGMFYALDMHRGTIKKILTMIDWPVVQAQCNAWPSSAEARGPL